MSDDYPCEKSLDAIRNFEGDHMELLDFVEYTWIYQYGVMKRHNYGRLHKVRFATGGWSGNEDIIEALRGSKSLFWVMYWKKSERGGAYWFELPSKAKTIVEDGLVSMFG